MTNSQLLQTLVSEGKKKKEDGSSGSDEYRTHPRYLEMAREVMGEIDFDPASSEAAQKNVKATCYCTKDSSPDGLEIDWKPFNHIWMNSPYSIPLIQKFVAKWLYNFVTDSEPGREPEGIMLVNSKTAARWYQSVLASKPTACWPDHRLGFIDSEGVLRDQNWQAQTFFYFGRKWQKFARVYGAIGFVQKLI